MSAWFRRRETEVRDDRYASTEDFRQLFDACKGGFFRLAYALTADRTLAQQCVVYGLEDCRSAKAVFREWAQKWARRVIIRNAVRLLRQATRHENIPAVREDADIASTSDLLNELPALAPILALPEVERVVYVLSAVEQYSTKEIALLLERLPEEIREARTRATEQLAADQVKPDMIHGAAQGRLTNIRLAV